MKIYKLLFTVFFASVTLLAADKPNIVFILGDDLGYGDLGCYGHPIIKTPSLDKLASEGIRFTDCHSASNNCSPSRAAIITGRHPYRSGIYDFLSSKKPFYLHPEETSVASMLKSAGYQTMFSGKWHLGTLEEGSDRFASPGSFGFDYWFANESNFPRDPDTLLRNGEPVGPLKGSQATVTAQECINWLESDKRDSEKPFCIFLWMNESHTPVTPSEEWRIQYDSDEIRNAAKQVPLGGPGVKRKSDPKFIDDYYACVAEMDHEIGRVLDTLDKLKLSENTFVMFTSDNGPEHRPKTSWGSPGKFRGAKGHMHEGGHRVPGIIRWPSKVSPGTESDVVINGTDILPTLCALAGAEVNTELTIDGGNFIPLLLEGSAVKRPEPLFWWMYHSRGEKQAALREGTWKIVAAQTIKMASMDAIKKSELTDFELYNMTDDMIESTDVSAQYPERFEDLKKKLISQFKNVQAEGRNWPTWGTAKVKGKGNKNKKKSSEK